MHYCYINILFIFWVTNYTTEQLNNKPVWDLNNKSLKNNILFCKKSVLDTRVIGPILLNGTRKITFCFWVQSAGASQFWTSAKHGGGASIDPITSSYEGGGFSFWRSKVETSVLPLKLVDITENTDNPFMRKFSSMVEKQGLCSSRFLPSIKYLP